MNLNVNGQYPQGIVETERTSAFVPSPISVIDEISRIMNNRIHDNDDSGVPLQRSAKLLLLELSKKDGVTQLELVKATQLKAPTISVTLQKLEKDGFVLRKSDNYDLRAMRVYLTEKGKEYNAKMLKRIKKEEDAVLRIFNESESKQLLILLERLKDVLVEERDKIKY